MMIIHGNDPIIRIVTIIITTVTTSWLNRKSGSKRNLMA
jgi:hypothetical protein